MCHEILGASTLSKEVIHTSISARLYTNYTDMYNLNVKFKNIKNVKG